jgi:hypothetical protein
MTFTTMGLAAARALAAPELASVDNTLNLTIAPLELEGRLTQEICG